MNNVKASAAVGWAGFSISQAFLLWERIDPIFSEENPIPMIWIGLGVILTATTALQAWYWWYMIGKDKL